MPRNRAVFHSRIFRSLIAPVLERERPARISLSGPAMAAQPDSEPRSLAAASQFLAVRVSLTVWKRSSSFSASASPSRTGPFPELFSFSSFLLAAVLSREIFSVLDAQLLPEFPLALPTLRIRQRATSSFSALAMALTPQLETSSPFFSLATGMERALSFSCAATLLTWVKVLALSRWPAIQPPAPSESVYLRRFAALERRRRR